MGLENLWRYLRAVIVLLFKSKPTKSTMHAVPSVSKIIHILNYFRALYAMREHYHQCHYTYLVRNHLWPVMKYKWHGLPNKGVLLQCEICHKIHWSMIHCEALVSTSLLPAKVTLLTECESCYQTVIAT